MKLSVVGLQFGDEGKGNIERYIQKHRMYLPSGEKYNYIARYHGGANAGESWDLDGEIIVSHQVPVGVGTDIYAVFLSGGVINPKRLAKEIDYLRSKGIGVDSGTYGISGRNQVVLLHHLMDEEKAEESEGAVRFGTTRSGISTAYASAARKIGMTFAEFVGPNFETILIERILPAVRKFYGSRMDIPPLEIYIEEYGEIRDRLKEFLRSEAELMEELGMKDSNVILAGCQSIGLDVYNGANRFSSSSVTTRYPLDADLRIGVMKLVQSAVGDRRATGNRKWITYDERITQELRGTKEDEGIEVGKTTGRPRDLGFCDAVLIRNNVKIARIGIVAATKIDRTGKLIEVLGTNRIPICTAYKYKGSFLRDLPEDSWVIEECEPVYTEFEVDPSNFTDIERLREKRDFSELSDKNQEFFDRMGEEIGARIDILSTGPYCDNKIIRA